MHGVFHCMGGQVNQEDCSMAWGLKLPSMGLYISTYGFPGALIDLLSQLVVVYYHTLMQLVARILIHYHNMWVVLGTTHML